MYLIKLEFDTNIPFFQNKKNAINKKKVFKAGYQYFIIFTSSPFENSFFNAVNYDINVFTKMRSFNWFK